MLYTIGYEGLRPEAFVAELQSKGIRVLVDVREMPLSRKKGFSKTALAALVEGAGIEYRHLRELGAPKAVRHKLRADGDWSEYCTGYSAHLEDQAAALDQVAQLATLSSVCLMCFEADYRECHRSLISEKLTAQHRVSDVVHLTPQRVNPSARAVA